MTIKEVFVSFLIRNIFFFSILSIYLFFIFHRETSNTEELILIAGKTNHRYFDEDSSFLGIFTWAIYVGIFQTLYVYIGFGGYKQWYNSQFIYISLFFVVLVVFVLSYGIAISKLVSIIGNLEKTEKGVIERKEFWSKEHKGGGRGGSYTNSDYVIHFQTINSKKTTESFNVSKKKYDSINEKDTLVIEYYRSFIRDFSKIYYKYDKKP